MRIHNINILYRNLLLVSIFEGGVKKWVIREKVKAPGKEVQKILFRKQKVPAVVQVEIAKISLAPNPTMIL